MLAWGAEVAVSKFTLLPIPFQWGVSGRRVVDRARGPRPGLFAADQLHDVGAEDCPVVRSSRISGATGSTTKVSH
jgi:hypothetical protein